MRLPGVTGLFDRMIFFTWSRTDAWTRSTISQSTPPHPRACKPNQLISSMEVMRRVPPIQE